VGWVIQKSLIAQENFFAALGNYTKTRHRYGVGGIDRRGQTIEMQALNWLNFSVLVVDGILNQLGQLALVAL